MGQFPAAVGKHARRLDIYQENGPLSDFRQRVIDGIKTAGDIVDEVKEVLDRLQ
jgi:hypothetical protein